MAETNTAREQALEVNREQKEFYERKVEQKRHLNPVMKLWEAWRDRVYRVWEGIGVFDDVLKLHHFKDFDLVMLLLSQRLAPGGRIVSFDPLETALVVRLVRWLYRPFQTNAAWERPFKQHNFDTIQKYFPIERIQGVVGLSKWVLPLAAVPLFSDATIRLGRRLHETDLRESRLLDSKLLRCMSVNLSLVRKS